MLWICVILITFFSGEAQKLGPIFRILGGSQVEIQKHPYVVSLQSVSNFGRRQHLCGATLISPSHILTAAHCFRRGNRFVIKAGSTSLESRDGCIVPIAKVTMHPNYRFLSQDYDIAVARLQKPLKLTEKIQTAKLPPYSVQIPRQIGTVVGWGATDPNQTISNNLKAVDLPIISDEECIRSYPKGLVTERMFCAQDATGSKDSCQGDSGGPLMINGTIYGIVSWGFDCGDPDNPGVYTRVPYFAEFIKKSVAEERKRSRVNWVRRWIRSLLC